MKRLWSVVLVWACVVGFPGIAGANDEYLISYRAQELETVQGMQQVYDRIEAAARNHCPTYREIRSHQDVRVCVRSVMEDLVGKVNHPRFAVFAEEGFVATFAEAAPLHRSMQRPMQRTDERD